MRNKAIQPGNRLSVILALLLVAAFSAPAQEKAKPSFKRDRVRRPTSSQPQAKAVPEALRLQAPAPGSAAAKAAAAPETGTESTKVKAGRGRYPTPVGRDPQQPAAVKDPRKPPAVVYAPRQPAPVPATPRRPNFSGAAHSAAVWTAEELCQNAGWREYFRVGLFEGLRAAVNDSSLGRWDYQEGRRYGRQDHEAQRVGSDLGSRAADQAAGPAAEEQVRREFMNLSRQPRRAPASNPPPYAPAGIWTVEPTLDEVFRDHPVGSVRHLGRDVIRAFSEWRIDPWGLYRYPNYNRFYDPAWNDPGAAFSFWARDHRRAASYHRLRSEGDRRRFREIFTAGFVGQLGYFYDRYLGAGYNQGYAAGWEYGEFINYEWHYRRGYTEGFNEGVIAAAGHTFRVAYGRAFAQLYDRAFAEWQNSSRPGLIKVLLRDGDDDGVFEPGEELLVEYEAANYGGRPGEFDISLNGRALSRPGRSSLYLPARQLVRSSQPLRARIAAGAAVRSRSDLELRLDHDSRRVELYVSYPLEFAGEAMLLDSDPLSGRAAIGVDIRNSSRRPIAGMAELIGLTGYDMRDQVQLRRVGPGAVSDARFELAGIHPLDLIDGGLKVDFAVTSDGVVHDKLRFHFPNSATNLHKRDLLLFMIDLSRDRHASPGDIATARDLMLARMKVDWRAAVRARGNPYKNDLKRNGTSTALGDLVQTYLRERRQIRNPAVFAGLGRQIEDLAGSMSGVHPMLRKSMRRLAQKMDY